MPAWYSLSEVQCRHGAEMRNQTQLTPWSHESEHIWRRAIVGQNIYGVLVYENEREPVWHILFSEDICSEFHRGKYESAELAMQAADERLTELFGEGWLQQMPNTGD